MPEQAARPPAPAPKRGPDNGDAHRYNKACDSCHVSKVRCVPDPQSPTGTGCRRCFKNGTACVFSPVGPRRRPARTKHDRIAELERRVKDMQLKLEKEVSKRVSRSTTAATTITTTTSRTASDDGENLRNPDGVGRVEGQGGTEDGQVSSSSSSSSSSASTPVLPPKTSASSRTSGLSTLSQPPTLPPVPLFNLGSSSGPPSGSTAAPVPLASASDTRGSADVDESSLRGTIPTTNTARPIVFPSFSPSLFSSSPLPMAATAPIVDQPQPQPRPSHRHSYPLPASQQQHYSYAQDTQRTPPSLPAPSQPTQDVIDQGLITEAQADQLTQEFRARIAGNLHALFIPDDEDEDMDDGEKSPSKDRQRTLRRRQPTFWLSILCAAATGSSELHTLASTLILQLKTIIDARVAAASISTKQQVGKQENDEDEQAQFDYNLDTIQALNIYLGFWDPVMATFDSSSQVIAMWGVGASLAVQIAHSSPLYKLLLDDAGNDKKSTPTATCGGCGGQDDGDPPPLPESAICTPRDAQLARVLLYWHWATLSLLIKSRQVSLLRLTPLVTPSMRILRAAAAARLQTATAHMNDADLRLVAWAKLVRITADALSALYHGHVVGGGLSNEARDEILKNFEKRRRRWLAECPFDLVNDFMMLDYHYYLLIISEVIYPPGTADFKIRSRSLPVLIPRKITTVCPSSSSSSSNTTTTQPDQNFFAPYKLPYTRKCIHAAQCSLDIATIPHSYPNSSPSASSSSHSHSHSHHHHHYTPPTSPHHLSSSSSKDATTNPPPRASSRPTTPPDILRHLGCFPYSRVFYALRFLLFIAHEVWRTQRHDLVDLASLRLDEYFAALKRRLQSAAAPAGVPGGGASASAPTAATATASYKYAYPTMWLNALTTRIEPWYRQLKELLDEDKRREALAAAAAAAAASRQNLAGMQEMAQQGLDTDACLLLARQQQQQQQQQQLGLAPSVSQRTGNLSQQESNAALHTLTSKTPLSFNLFASLAAQNNNFSTRIPPLLPPTNRTSTATTAHELLLPQNTNRNAPPSASTNPTLDTFPFGIFNDNTAGLPLANPYAYMVPPAPIPNSSNTLTNPIDPFSSTATTAAADAAAELDYLSFGDMEDLDFFTTLNWDEGGADARFDPDQMFGLA